MRRGRALGIAALSTGAVVLAALGAWAIAIGPDAVGRILTHGTTTVWDHLEYPGRTTQPAPTPRPWPSTAGDEPTVTLDGSVQPVDELLAAHDALALVVVHDGSVVHEWSSPDHDPGTPSMLFSVSKSVTSLLVGAAVQDGLIGSVDDPVTRYLPELATRGFDTVTVEDALRMDTGSSYVEDDNPFGVHVEFNYTSDLESAILALSAGDQHRGEFTYRSGDNAVLGLILHRVLAPESITEYLQRRFLDPLGAGSSGRWSTDRDGGLERTWCCLALTARDLARFGELVLDDGVVDGTRLVPEGWLADSFSPAYPPERWPTSLADSPLTGYGYQWWLAGDDAVVALGKDGQYLYVDRSRDVVVVRTGTSQGGIGWVDLLAEIATTVPLGAP
ncbi:serine hydrolase domain-containing protein [Actinotalea sp.]|uniref:serine hydrolase domain-containing protein n=1 Tax=Actinotalea sp. TaxID=1872145 RepID=UPI0035654482